MKQPLTSDLLCRVATVTSDRSVINEDVKHIDQTDTRDADEDRKPPTGPAEETRDEAWNTNQLVQRVWSRSVWFWVSSLFKHRYTTSAGRQRGGRSNWSQTSLPLLHPNKPLTKSLNHLRNGSGQSWRRRCLERRGYDFQNKARWQKFKYLDFWTVVNPVTRSLFV